MTGFDPPQLVRHPAGWAIQIDAVTTVYGKTLEQVARNYRTTTGRDMVLVAINPAHLDREK